MSRILIKNATVITMLGHDKVYPIGEVAIENDKIVACGPKGTVAADWQAEKVIDAEGCIVMPGFINCHTHAAMTLLRSYADDLPLMEWLTKKIWPLEDKLNGEDVYWGTKLCILEMIKNGTTTFTDMYFFMEDVAKAVEETGIRAVLSRGMVGVGPSSDIAIDESKAFVENWQGKGDGRITVMLGPHAPYTCPPDYLKKVIALAKELKVGIHIHLAETETEVKDIGEQNDGKTPIELMEEVGLFELPVVAAHCVHLTDRDMEILKKYNVGVAHNPESNMKLASGVAPVPKMLTMGINVGLGTDGAASNNNLDMMEEMRSAALLHKVSTMDPTVLHSYEALSMATVNGAKVLGKEKEIGVLSPGYKADLIILDAKKPHLYPQHDFIAHLVYSAQSADVETVIINGKIVMENRKVLTMDENEILEKVSASALRLVGDK